MLEVNTEEELVKYCLQQSKIMVQRWLVRLQTVEKNRTLKMYPGCSIRGITEVSSLILLNWCMKIVHNLESQALVKSLIATF